MTFVGPGGTVHNDNVSDLNRNVNASDWRFLFSGDALTSLIGRINHPCKRKELKWPSGERFPGGHFAFVSLVNCALEHVGQARG